MNGALWFVVVLVGGLIGLLVYVVVREEKRGMIPPDVAQAYEPFQKAQLGDPQTHYAHQSDGCKRCRRCGSPLESDTRFCPVCGLRA